VNALEGKNFIAVVCSNWRRAGDNSCNDFHSSIDYSHLAKVYNKLIRRWDSERELSLRRRRKRTKYNRLLHKFRHRSTRLCVGTQVYQIQ